MQLLVVLVDRRRDVVNVFRAVGVFGSVVPHIPPGFAEVVSCPGQEVAGLLPSD